MTSKEGPPLLESELDRRQLLARAGALGLSATALSTWLAACGDDDGNGNTTPNGDGSLPSGLSAKGEPVMGGTLTLAWIYEPPGSLDPQKPPNYTIGDFNTLLLVYDQLVQLKPGSLDLQPGLAEEWEITKGGREYTFHLRDAQFSNGDPVTAEDVVFSLERFRSPKINAAYAFLAAAIDRVRALDGKTVRVSLSFPQGAFLDYISHVTASVVPRRVLERLGAADFGKEPVGTGPFTFKGRQAGRTITLSRNSNYWKTGQPYLDEVVFDYIADDNARILSVTSGDATAAVPIPYSQLARVKRQDGVRLQEERIGGLTFVVPNVTRAPFEDVVVRRALDFATPRDAIVSNVFGGAVEVANSQIPRLKFWDSSVSRVPYDIDRARKLLATTSVPDGFEARLLFVGSDNDSKQIGTVVQEAWSEIGVKLSLDGQDIGTLLDRFLKFNYDLVMQPPDAFVTDVNADDQTARYLLDPMGSEIGGYYGYEDPKTTRLLDRAGRTVDEDVRRDTFGELQRYVLYDSPANLPLVFPTGRTLVRESVQNLVTLPNTSWRMEEVWLNA